MKLHALLSKRETQVAELLAWGASKKEVASKLFVSTRTELTGNGDLFRIGRDRRIARVTRTFRRYGEDEGTEDFFRTY